MKNFGKISATVLLIGTLALTGCQNANVETKGANSPEPQAPGNIGPTAEATATPAEPFAFDLVNPVPMGQDIAALNANTSIDTVYEHYTPEEFQAASTLGLNWLEQAMAVPTMFENSRIITEDNVRLKNFIQAMTPNAQTLVDAQAASNGAMRILPYGDNEGTILANNDDGTPFELGLKWNNSVPETTWRDVATIGIQEEGYPYGIMVYAVADHKALDEKGQEQTLTIAYSATLYDFTGTWQVNNLNWDIENYPGK